MAEVGGRRRLRLRTAPSSLLMVLSIVWACATAPTVPYTLDASPFVFLPAGGADIYDQRGRFREILCAVDEAHGHQLPEYRPCEAILHRFTDEPAGTGEPVHLGPARSKLRVAVVAGLGAECFGAFVTAFPYALEHLQGFGYQTASITVDGLSSSTNNGRQVKDAVVALDLAPDERLVLVGYSKGTPDILEGLATYPELAQRVAAVVSVSGSVNGSPLADDAPESMLAMLEYLPGSACGSGDGGALDSLKPSTRRDFARTHELPATVRYYSLASFAQREQISFGLRGTYDDLAKIDPRNDSQLLFYDQIIAGGALLGFVNADHWAVALPISRDRPVLAATVINRNEFPREVLLEAIVRHVEEQLLAMPPRGFGSASRLRGQAWRQHA
jgi:pimeloyl-ACP methyl ester carboxylesterase